MDLIDFLKEYWSLIVTGVGIIYSYVTVKADIKEHEKRIACIEDEIKTLNPIWIEIKERLVAIETTLKIISKEK